MALKIICKKSTSPCTEKKSAKRALWNILVVGDPGRGDGPVGGAGWAGGGEGRACTWAAAAGHGRRGRGRQGGQGQGHRRWGRAQGQSRTQACRRGHHGLPGSPSGSILLYESTRSDLKIVLVWKLFWSESCSDLKAVLAWKLFWWCCYLAVDSETVVSQNVACTSQCISQ